MIKVCSMCGKEIKDDGYLYVSKGFKDINVCHSKCKLEEAAEKLFKKYE